MKLMIYILAALLSGSCYGFTLASSTNSDFRGWRDANIYFLLNKSNCPSSMDVEATLKNAFDVWNNISNSRVKLVIAGTTTSTTASFPTTIYCETNFQTVTGADQNYVPGAAATNKSGNYATAGIFYLNASSGTANISNYNATSLAIILAHEAGHILGLGHSEDESALMYYDASAKTQLRLAQDDIDGAAYLYPRNELGGDGLYGCGRVEARTPPSSPTKLFTLFLLLAPLLLLLHGRRSSKLVR